MPTAVLTDLARDLWVEGFSLHSAAHGPAGHPPWSVTKRALRGGRRDGVDLIRVDNGALSFSLLPTRGMGIWRGAYRGYHLGWDSPVADGPIHPAFVNLSAAGGLGWLDGFDELLARCGLEQVGPPVADGRATTPLHGRIANLPAHYVAVHVSEEPPFSIAIEGHVTETRLFGPHLRMVSRTTTTPGSNRLVVRDEFTNLGDAPAEMQVLYHWNFGPPFLEEGSRVVVPARAVAPQTPRAAEGIDRYATYAAPAPGFAEEVYLFELHGHGPDGRTLALLRNRAGDKAVALRFTTTQLPCFTAWKNTGGRRDGYVTGLEPATSYPNPRPFERSRGRVVFLPPGRSHVAEMTLDVLDSAHAVAAVEAEVATLQGQGAPTIHRKPGEPFAPGN